MATGPLVSGARQQFLNVNGDPLPGARLFTYEAGTSTPAPIYTDADLTIPFSNPAIADAGGFLTIFMPEASQKWVLQDQFGVTQWTVDPVPSVLVTPVAFGHLFSFEGSAQAAVTATTFPTGSSYTALHPGTAVFLADSTTLTGTYTFEATGLMDTGGTLTVALMDLDSGAPDTPLAQLTITSLTGETRSSGTITFGAPGSVKRYGIKTKVSANTGFAWGISLVRSA